MDELFQKTETKPSLYFSENKKSPGPMEFNKRPLEQASHPSPKR